MPPTRRLSGTPLSLGYRFCAEWEPQEATWFSWPRPEGISFPGKYHTIPENLARIIAQIVPRQRVCINVPNENWETIVRGVLKAHKVSDKRVSFFHIPTNESWCRDHGPAFVVKPPARRGGKAKLAVVDWGFNAWGGKYPPYDADDRVPTEIARRLGLPVFVPAGPDGVPVVMEGGSVEFNGSGTVLTTEQCLLNRNRNPHLSREQIERFLKDYYGQQQVLWLGRGIEGDDTDGHIDDLARFVAADTIVTTVEDDPKDPNYRVLRANRRRLDGLRDPAGKPFRIVELPMPGVIEHDGQRLPATYANFLFVNGACLVPTYGHRDRDRKALAILQSVLPRHEVIGIDCVELIWGLGSIHCLTQQQPRV